MRALFYLCEYSVENLSILSSYSNNEGGLCMTNKRWNSLQGSIGFYATMAFCLLAIAVSGYFLLSDREAEPPQDYYEDVPQAVTSIPELTPIDTEPSDETAGKMPVAELLPEPEDMPDSKPVSAPAEVSEPVPVEEPPRLVVSPLKGKVLAAFSVDDLIYSKTMDDWRTHDGVDIAAAIGTTVMSASAGTVTAVFNDSMMGTTVVVEHTGGYETTYANLQPTPPVKAGDTVSAGQIIGAVGTTASAESAQSPHLHFTVTKNGELVDPNEFLNE